MVFLQEKGFQISDSYRATVVLKYLQLISLKEVISSLNIHSWVEL